MSKYYILYFEGKGYVTTSHNFCDIAIGNGYKYLGMVYGRNISHNDFSLINITTEMKVFAGI